MKKLLAVCLLITTSCATVHTGQVLHDDQGLLVSVATRDELSTDHFALVELTFENPGASWVRIGKPYLDLGDPQLDQAVIVTAGADLKAWAESMELQKNLKDQNLRTFLGSIAVMGILGGAFTKNEYLKPVEGAIGLGALTALSVETLKTDLERARDVRVFPETHLYAGDVLVAPGLYIKRWVVFYSPSRTYLNGLAKVVLHYTDPKDSSAHTFEIPLAGGRSVRR